MDGGELLNAPFVRLLCVLSGWLHEFIIALKRKNILAVYRTLFHSIGFFRFLFNAFLKKVTMLQFVVFVEMICRRFSFFRGHKMIHLKYISRANLNLRKITFAKTIKTLEKCVLEIAIKQLLSSVAFFRSKTLKLYT